jgi:hypothetical protein
VDPGAVIAAVGAVGGIAAAVTVVGASFRTGRSAQVLANYKAEAESWQGRALADEEALAEANRQLTGLRIRVAALQDMVTGKTAVEQLAADFRSFMALREQNFTQVIEHMDAAIAEALKQVNATRGEVRDVHESVEAIASALNRGNRPPGRSL